MLWTVIVAAMGGWTFDDFCGTPPRPWPGPWPWILRKVIAAAGGVAAVYVIGPNVGNPADVVSVAVLGGLGGVVLAGLVGMAGGGVRGQ
jgi:hypothetical protein